MGEGFLGEEMKKKKRRRRKEKKKVEKKRSPTAYHRHEKRLRYHCRAQ
jgi:hypothetical protein